MHRDLHGHFTAYGDSFEKSLHDLCEKKNLILNYEKCHFMVSERIVLGHIVFGKGIEVDRAKVEVITNW